MPQQKDSLPQLTLSKLYLSQTHRTPERKYWVIVFSTVLLFMAALISYAVLKKNVKQPNLLQQSMPVKSSTVETAAATSSAKIAPVSSQVKATQTKPPPKSSYKIAIFGDSMVDTMGETLEYLQAVLKQTYPHTEIFYYNYGIGSQNISSGLERFQQEFSYKSRHYPPISKIDADVIILGSFAYNPYFPHDIEKYRTNLTNLILLARRFAKDVYLLAEVAPLQEEFGKGVHGVNWSADKAIIHASYIVEQLDTALSLAKKLGVPVINAYEQSQSAGKFGSKIYVNGDDGIHPSERGHQFMAQIIASTIKLK